MSHLIFVLCFVFLTVQASIYTNKAYKWTKNPEVYQTKGKTLKTNYKQIYYKFSAFQCAYICLKETKCKSFSHEKVSKYCEFHNTTHEDDPTAYIDDPNRDYHTRSAYQIDEEALGPCGIDACNNNGKCLETRTADDDLIAICLCDVGWTGTTCETADPQPVWGNWKAWGPCSVSCGKGWKKRTRDCEDATTGSPVDKHLCFGDLFDSEYAECTMTSCPSWDEWGAWGECSAVTSCGRGLKVRNRTCSNGGTAGVDRYCLGDSSQSAPCMDMDCKSTIRIRGGTQHGEGRVEIYNDIKQEWGLVCADQWNQNMADMICKQVALPGAYQAITDGRFGNGDGYFGLTGITCSGSERTLQMCKHNKWSLATATCPGSMAAGVQCQVNGVWSLWNEWGTCSVTCADGIQTRTRQCDHPPALHGGRACQGEDQQTKPCTLPPCPSNGTWGIWSSWSPCDASCGYGSQTRNRTCDMSVANEACPGDSQETRICYAGSCSVDGVWKQWSDWSSCSVTCGNGTHYRNRTCDGPFYGGRDCGPQASEMEWCKDKECPIDGVWNPWGEWGVCSHTCGGGTRRRSRTCEGPYYDGAECPGSASDTGSCNTFSCPVDGVWMSWQEWQPCNVTCGGGMQIRQRICDEPKHGGASCVGSATEAQECNTNECPINGIWKPWGSWGECTLSCGNGTQVRKRTCDGPYYGGKDCDPPSDETQSCNTHPCPVDGIEGDWSSWGQCSVSCGDGIAYRQRSCIGPFHGGADCQKPLNESGTCNDGACPVDGEWWPWAEWQSCDVSCGGGVQIRKRLCLNPRHGGEKCIGKSNQLQSCNMNPCPINGIWTEWGDWSDCSVTCDFGTQRRYRNCTGPFHGGKDCIGFDSDTQSCSLPTCPIDGVLYEWSQWSECDVTCGGGVSRRNRTCFGPFHGGADCAGALNETKECNMHNCPIDAVFEPWSSWTPCSLTCGGGTRDRERNCTGPFFGGAECPGAFNETESCNTYPCPIDGAWMPWAQWSECTVTCGGGTQRRDRKCNEAQYGGNECQGLRNESRICNKFHCPVDGQYEPWSEWGECTVSCGGGTQMRNRACNSPKYGGADCQGAQNETQDCNTQNCPIDAVVSVWADWSACSVTCGGGAQNRTRNCTEAKYGGRECDVDLGQTRRCNNHHCPVDGVNSQWSDWESCSVTCNGGRQRRTRTCTLPKYGGKACDDLLEESRDCNIQPCPINCVWQTWSEWAECSKSCGNGTKTRSRDAYGPFHGGRNCTGPTVSSQSCNTQNCPVDGIWEEWSAWTECPVTCAGGLLHRSRTCDGPYFGGDDCHGDHNETKNCNTNPCPVDGYWLEWTDWSECTTTCGGGISQRTRDCQQPKYGGQNCQGNNTENVDCSENPCPIPGDWLEWTVWSPCSVTCGGGTRTRSRECDMTSYGNLTAPCEGDANEVGDCHTFSCTPHARTCSEWKERGLEASTMADVDPDGEDGELTSVKVYCDLTAEDGVGVTILGHDNEERTQVVGYEGAGEYKMAITYNVSLDQAIAIIEASAKCKQFLKWECKAALIHNPNGNGVITTGWKNRTGGIADYFSGAMPGTESCACGMTDTCADPGLLCNCDMNDATWREDSGYLTYKPDLPVTEFIAGDTGGLNEDGYKTVGPLSCWG